MTDEADDEDGLSRPFLGTAPPAEPLPGPADHDGVSRVRPYLITTGRTSTDDDVTVQMQTVVVSAASKEISSRMRSITHQKAQRFHSACARP